MGLNVAWLFVCDKWFDFESSTACDREGDGEGEGGGEEVFIFVIDKWFINRWSDLTGTRTGSSAVAPNVGRRVFNCLSLAVIYIEHLFYIGIMLYVQD